VKVDIPRERIFKTAEAQVEFLDPALIGEGAGNRIGTQMFETLVQPGIDSLSIVPAQAEKWTTSDNGTVWTFTLRDGLTWSDGAAITTADFVYSYERALNPSAQSRNAQLYWNILGAKEYNTGASKDFKSVGIKALDAKRLEFTLISPAPYFLDLLAYVGFAPTPRHVIESHGKNWTRPENIVVNGPFTLSMWKSGDRIELKRNAKYWNAENVWLDGLIFYETSNENMAHDWYESGKLHWTPGLVPLDIVPSLRKSRRSDYYVDDILCVYYYVFNVLKPPFDNVQVRRAFNMAFDKGQLVRQVLGQGQRPATHLVPPYLGKRRGYSEVRGDSFNPEKARKLLADAGYPGGKGLPELRLTYNTSEGHRLIAEFFQQSLKRHLGVDITISNMEWKSLLQALHSREFQISRASWCADYPDPENFLSVFHSQGENNYPGYNNSEFDRLLEKLRRTGNQEERNRLTAKAEGILNSELPLLPMYFYVRSYMLKDFVRGLEPDPMNQYRLHYLWFGQPGESKPARGN
jgi:oligopeptide transport system substrate-binding protein